MYRISLRASQPCTLTEQPLKQKSTKLFKNNFGVQRESQNSAKILLHPRDEFVQFVLWHYSILWGFKVEFMLALVGYIYIDLPNTDLTKILRRLTLFRRTL